MNRLNASEPSERKKRIPRTASFRLDVVTEQRVLVAQVEAAAGDDGVRPGGLVAAVRRGETALLLVRVRRRLDQRDRPGVLPADVQMTVGRGDRTSADRPLLPFRSAGLQIDADEARLIGS